MITMPSGSTDKQKFLTFSPFDILDPLHEASPVETHAYEIHSSSLPSIAASKLELDTAQEPYALSVLSSSTPF